MQEKKYKFIRKNGRIIPIRIKDGQRKREQKSALARAADSEVGSVIKSSIKWGAIFAGSSAVAAVLTGRLAPLTGFVNATRKVRNSGAFKAAKAFGVASIGLSGKVGNNMPGVGNKFAKILPSFAKLGRKWKRASMYKKAMGGTKFYGNNLYSLNDKLKNISSINITEL